MQRIDNSGGDQYLSLPASGGMGKDQKSEIAAHEERIKFLKSKYDLSSRDWSAKDRDEVKERESAIRKINGMSKRRQEIGIEGSRSSASLAAGHNSCLDSCWNCCSPFRILIGIILLLLSWLICVSLGLASIDRILNSPCGPSCGFVLEQSTLPNPMEIILVSLAPYFPLDMALFAIVVAYLFLCCIYGVVQLGVRFLWVKMYDVNVSHTPPNGMLMLIWLVSFMVLSLVAQAYNLVPYYTTYGTQFFQNITNGTSKNFDCNSTFISDESCVMTEVSTYYQTLITQLPAFGIALFYGTCLLLVMFFFCSLYSIVVCQKARTTGRDLIHRRGL